MELEEIIDKYRGTKRSVRFALVGIVALLPGLNIWMSQGEALEARRVQAENQVNEERQKFESAKQKVAELPALMAKLSEIEDELIKAKQILPDQIHIDQILASLGKLEKELDVKIIKFTPQPETQPAPGVEYRELPVDLVLHASFPQAMRFLDQIVHMPNLTHLRNIQFGNIASRDEAASKSVLTLETSVRLILFKGI